MDETMKQPSILRRMWNTLCGKNPRENSDGSITTRFGDNIILPNFRFRPGGAESNQTAVMTQPRVRQLMEQLSPLRHAPAGERVHLDDNSGCFYLASAWEKQGAAAQPLGQIDITLEKPLLHSAAEQVILQRMFGDARHDNPITITGNGTVYPKNNPSDYRGHVRINPKTGFKK
jgi:hypothetical protein